MPSADLSRYDASQLPDVSGKRFGVVVSEWNYAITNSLREACEKTLLDHGVSQADLFLMTVPGSFELSAGAFLISKNHAVDVIICLGCLIKGETNHDNHIAGAVANSLAMMGVLYGIPCIFGVLTVNNEQQAWDRAGGKWGNKGVEAAITAIKMAGFTTKED